MSALPWGVSSRSDERNDLALVQHLRGSRIVPYTSGGTGNIIGWALAQRLTAVLGQNVILDNRPGGAGDVGAEIVAKHCW
jgi:hypothetical protein